MSATKEIDCDHVPDFAVCPYCGFKHSYSIETVSGETECADCCRRFYLLVEITAFFTSTKIEEECDE